MTCEEGAWERSEWSIDLSRFLEYTAEPIAQHFKSLSNEAVAKILALPTLFTYEGAGTLPSRVGKITKLTRSLREVRITWEPYIDVPPILPDVIYALFPQLDIDLGWESSRTHWAIKDVPLLEILRSAKIAPAVTPNAPQLVITPNQTPWIWDAKPNEVSPAQPMFNVEPAVMLNPQQGYMTPSQVPMFWREDQFPTPPNRLAEARETLFVPPAPNPSLFLPQPPTPPAPPVKVFISYSWDSKEHKEWVEGLAKCLRSEHGIDATIDTWDVWGGQDLAVYMETSIRSADRVLVIYTESAVNKATARTGGIGYEHMIVTAEMMQDLGTSKFIPIVRQVIKPYTVPPQFVNRLRYDLGDGPEFASQLEQLVKELLNIRPVRPPLGRSPYQTS